MAEVRIIQNGQIAVLELDNPPVNATSSALRRALLDALSKAEADPDIAAIVLAGAGRTFIVGGDITEFSRPPVEPHLPDVINRIEASSKPVVVAWHGTALGGGCEIGLGAHYRVMDAQAHLGLPEVKLGLIPGAGGTQRLPRLIGLPAALDLIATGRMVDAKEALAIGLVDEIAEGDLRAAAIAAATRMIGKFPPRLSLRAPTPPDAGAWQSMIAKVTRDAKGRIAPLRAIDLISLTLTTPFITALHTERQIFFDLMSSEQSKALRHLFFAEREVGKHPDLMQIAPRRIETIGVVGIGTMGAGIAVAFLDAGYRVILLETSDMALSAGRERIEGLYSRSLRSGRLDETTKAERLARATFSTSMSSLSQADLIIEAVFEDMAVKKDLLGRLEANLRADAIIATNTSYLDIEAMADFLSRPERFIGLHFFSPAHVMKLMEIVRPRRASPQVVTSALALAKSLKKIAVLCGVCEGFIGNRILAKFRAQCEFMLEEGAMPQEIDRALEAFGLAMGPFAVQDLAGLDIAWARRKRLAATRHPDERDVPLVDRLCEMGRFGQKAGRGWHHYPNGKREPDPEVEALVRAHAASTGRTPRAFSTEAIQSRVLAAMVNEAAKIVTDGTARRPLDIDIVLVHGYGFPNWRGGPMQEADSRGLPALLAEARANAARDGRGFEVAPLLEELATSGRRFSDLNII